MVKSQNLSEPAVIPAWRSRAQTPLHQWLYRHGFSLSQGDHVLAASVYNDLLLGVDTDSMCSDPISLSAESYTRTNAKHGTLTNALQELHCPIWMNLSFKSVIVPNFSFDLVRLLELLVVQPVERVVIWRPLAARSARRAPTGFVVPLVD